MRNKYEYDVCIVNREDKTYLKKGISGAELKKYQIPINKVKYNQQINVYKRTINESGTKIRLHDNFSINELINRALNIDFYYNGVNEINYEYSYDCEANNCDSICRCGRMEDVYIKPNSIDEEQVIDGIINNIFSTINKKILLDNEILEYCIERILRRCNLGDESNYYVDYGPSYYGDEINCVSLQNIGILSNKIAMMFSKSPLELIKFVLEDEYGYLIESVEKAKNCFIKIVSSNKLVIPNKRYSNKLDSKKIEKYKDYKYPIGIYVKNYKKYKVIDGYHRYFALVKPNTEHKIIVID